MEKAHYSWWISKYASSSLLVPKDRKWPFAPLVCFFFFFCLTEMPLQIGFICVQCWIPLVYMYACNNAHIIPWIPVHCWTLLKFERGQKKKKKKKLEQSPAAPALKAHTVHVIWFPLLEFLCSVRGLLHSGSSWSKAAGATSALWMSNAYYGLKRETKIPIYHFKFLSVKSENLSQVYPKNYCCSKLNVSAVEENYM